MERRMQHVSAWISPPIVALLIAMVSAFQATAEPLSSASRLPRSLTASGPESSEPLSPLVNLVIASDTDVQYQSGDQWLPVVSAWVYPAWPGLADAMWVWKTYQVSSDEALNGTPVIAFRRRFSLPTNATNLQGTIRITADNAYELSVNGSLVGHDGVLDVSGTDEGWASVETYQLSLRTGENEIIVRTINYRGNGSPSDNPAGMLFRADIIYSVATYAVSGEVTKCLSE